MPAEPKANTPLQIAAIRRLMRRCFTSHSLSVESSSTSKMPRPPGMITVSNSGQGSKIVRSGTTVKPLDESTDPRVVPTVSISYSHSPWLRMRTSANASFGPAISSNWKPGNSTMATVILRICESDEFGVRADGVCAAAAPVHAMKPRRKPGWPQAKPGAIILRWQNFDDQRDVTSIDRMGTARLKCAVPCRFNHVLRQPGEVNAHSPFWNRHAGYAVPGCRTAGLAWST